MALKPLYEEMVRKILSGENIFIDETPVKLLAKEQCDTAYSWVVVGGNDSNPPYRVYDFRKNRCYGKGRVLDNIMIERLWRSVKYEDIYPKGYESLNLKTAVNCSAESKKSQIFLSEINCIFNFYGNPIGEQVNVKNVSDFKGDKRKKWL